MNNRTSKNINFTMDDNIIISNDKKNIFKELIIEYLIRNIFGDSNDN